MEPIYYRGFIDTSLGGRTSWMLNTLTGSVPWVAEQSARKECFMSKDSRSYQYIDNGPVYESVDFHPNVEDIMERINRKYGYNMNVCFLNYYEDGTKALGWHSDDSPYIDQTEPICVVSIGEERDIWWKPIDFKGTIPDEWKQNLANGSLFIMPPGMQSTHRHRIPKGDRVMGPRISLTFRSWKS